MQWLAFVFSSNLCVSLLLKKNTIFLTTRIKWDRHTIEHVTSLKKEEEEWAKKTWKVRVDKKMKWWKELVRTVCHIRRDINMILTMEKAKKEETHNL